MTIRIALAWLAVACGSEPERRFACEISPHAMCEPADRPGWYFNSPGYLEQGRVEQPVAYCAWTGTPGASSETFMCFRVAADCETTSDRVEPCRTLKPGELPNFATRKR